MTPPCRGCQGLSESASRCSSNLQVWETLQLNSQCQESALGVLSIYRDCRQLQHGCFLPTLALAHVLRMPGINHIASRPISHTDEPLSIIQKLCFLDDERTTVAREVRGPPRSQIRYRPARRDVSIFRAFLLVGAHPSTLGQNSSRRRSRARFPQTQTLPGPTGHHRLPPTLRLSLRRENIPQPPRSRPREPTRGLHRRLTQRRGGDEHLAQFSPAGGK